MISLVQKGTSQQVLPGFLEPVAVQVLSADSDFTRARDRLTEFRNAQAALILALPPLGVDDLWIHQHQLSFGIFFEGDINYCQALRDADLGRGQANAVGGIHGFEHVRDEFFQISVKHLDGSRRCLEHRIAIFNDGINHSVVFYLLAVALKISQGLAQGIAAEFLQRAAGEGEGDHSLGRDTGGGNHTDIGTFVGGLHRFSGGKINRLQGTAQSGDRLKVTAEAYLLAIRNAAFDAASMIAASRKASVAARRPINYFIMYG